MEEVKEIPVKKLEIDPVNVRKHVDIDGELIESIKRQGIIEPLIVRPRKNNGGYGIVSGSRRYSAALEAEIDLLPCIVRDLDDVDARATSISENKHRKDIPIWRMNEVINELTEELDDGLAKEEKIKFIREKTGLGRTTIQDYLEIGKLPKHMQARLKKPSERSKTEKEALKQKTIAAEKKIPRAVLTKLARDEDFQKWAEKEPDKAHQMATFAAKKGQNQVNKVLERVKRRPKLDPRKAYKVGAKSPLPSFLAPDLERAKQEVRELKEGQTTYTKQMLKFGVGAWILGLALFASYMVSTTSTGLDIFLDFPDNIFLFLEMPPLVISLLMGSAAAPLSITAAGLKSRKSKISKLEEKVQSEYQKSALDKATNRLSSDTARSVQLGEEGIQSSGGK